MSGFGRFRLRRCNTAYIGLKCSPLILFLPCSLCSLCSFCSLCSPLFCSLLLSSALFCSLCSLLSLSLSLSLSQTLALALSLSLSLAPMPLSDLNQCHPCNHCFLLSPCVNLFLGDGVGGTPLHHHWKPDP